MGRRACHDHGVTKLAGAHAVITGGSSGIGLATAHALVARGAKVSLLARDASRLDAAAAEVASSVGAGAQVVATASVDVTDPAGVERAFDRVTGALGPCDVLVTCAGTAHPGYFEQLDDAVFREQMEVDYFGTAPPDPSGRAVDDRAAPRSHRHRLVDGRPHRRVRLLRVRARRSSRCAGWPKRCDPSSRPTTSWWRARTRPTRTRRGFDRENELKPAETARISAAIKPRSADQVARAIVRGIERDRLVITADFQTSALARAAGLLAPYVRRSTDRQVRRARRDR